MGYAGLLLATLTFGACAVYTPQPLDGADVDALLAVPDRAALARQATRRVHPRLAPQAIDFAQPLNASEIAVIAVLANPDLRSLRAQQQLDVLGRNINPLAC